MTAGTMAKTDLVGPERAPGALPRGGRAVAAWFAVIALYAAAIALFTGPGHDRVWGTWAAGAYAVSALAALLWRSRGTDAALLLSLAGALTGPVTWLLTIGPGANETKVFDRATVMLLHHGTPYFSAAQLTHHAGVTAYNPYLPGMMVFGLPHAVGLPGVLGSPTAWLIAVSATLFLVAFRLARRPDPARTTMLAISSPMIAFPLSVTITDPPIVALICLVLALLGREALGREARSPILPAAIILGVACAMKTTAWLALPVLAAMLAAREGARTAIKFSAVTAVTTAALFVVFAPALLVRPAELIQNTVLFPLGLTHIATPAASPVPGHLIAQAGQAGHVVAIILLAAAGLAIAAWIVLRPPCDLAAATWRLAVTLTVIFALDPEARFGYFDYPIALCGWIVLCYGVPPLRVVWRVRSAICVSAIRVKAAKNTPSITPPSRSSR